MISEPEITLECQICFEEYNIYNRKPAVLDCGHSICQVCLTSILSSSSRHIKKCPFDNVELRRSYDQYPVNWAYIDIISNYRKNNKSLREYPNYKELRTDEGVYKGQTSGKTNIKNGYGQMEYNDRSYYLGNWKNDKRCGKGRFVYPDKKEYDGDWEDNLPHGYGKYLFNAGEIKSYEGSWRMGKFFGMGKIKYKNDTELETIFIDGVACCDILKFKSKENRMLIGQFENSKLIGKGYEVTNEGDVYIGFFDPDTSGSQSIEQLALKKSRRGVIHFRNGNKFEGNFKNDKMDGRGVFYYNDGSIYDGEFLDGKRHGRGAMTFYINGDVYDGMWADDKMCGEGVYTKKSGEVYKGHWEKGMKNGKGKLMLNNGYSYDGDWLNDKKHGKGVETFPDEESYYGDFVNGMKEGQGLFVFSNGDTYKGQWQKDKMHGIGSIVTRDGEEVNAKWSNGMLVKETNGKGKDGKNCIIF